MLYFLNLDSFYKEEVMKVLQRKYEEVAGRLSSIHLLGSTSPRELCTATLVMFNKEHEDYLKHKSMQFELFDLAKELGKEWIG